MSTSIEVDIEVARGAFDLRAAFAMKPGITVLFGPSGAGKSTLLRTLAGLESGARGLIRVASSVWLDSRHGVDRPAHRREVGYVFQDADLLPHLSVRGNLDYAQRRAVPGGDTNASKVVDALGLAGLLERMPASLSGGERRRVALARALLRSPRLLLLDEPLAALDEPVRHELLRLLATLPARHDMPILLVTHNLGESLSIADEAIWLSEGRVRLAGAAQEVFAAPEVQRWRGLAPAADDPRAPGFS
jgi:molybdate transport system ATP-binding protein